MLAFFNGRTSVAATAGSAPADHSSAPDHRLLPAPAFRHALRVERMRAERSGHGFVLMLVEDARAGRRESAVIRRAAGALLRSIRETDIAGWNVDEEVLGIVFTDTGSKERDAVLATLRARMNAALDALLPGDHLVRLRLSFYVFPDTADAEPPDRPRIEALYPDLMQRHASRRVSRAVKRGLDAAFSLVALIVLAPMFLAIAIAIKVSSPGPVLFRQQRIGQYGIPFTFLKFRSMHTGNDAAIHRAFVTDFIRGTAVGDSEHRIYKLTRDPRVTPVGRFLRRTSLDELPQLINALKGEMSLVGPRPPVPYEFESYDVWHRRRLLEAKPGITGLWQVSGRSRLCFDDMVRLDLKYSNAWSLWLDMKILLSTPRAVMTGEGAY